MPQEHVFDRYTANAKRSQISQVTENICRDDAVLAAGDTEG
jgi:hypothetical protein